MAHYLSCPHPIGQCKKTVPVHSQGAVKSTSPAVGGAAQLQGRRHIFKKGKKTEAGNSVYHTIHHKTWSVTSFVQCLFWMSLSKVYRNFYSFCKYYIKFIIFLMNVVPIINRVFVLFSNSLLSYRNLFSCCELH